VTTSGGGYETLSPMKRLQHGLALVLAATLTYYLFAHISEMPRSRILGDGPGDNVTFAWNVWWACQWLGTSSSSLFHTYAVFWPIGTDLTLHTFSPLPTVLASLLAARTSLLVGLNGVVAFQVFLNIVAAYALNWSITRRLWPSLAGATLFGVSPYLAAHLLGHFNLIAVWPLPLAALGWRTATSGSLRRGIVTGAILSISFYVDYYICIYATCLVLSLAAAELIAIEYTDRVSASRMPRRLFYLAIGLCGIAAAISFTGGTVFRLWGQEISMRSPENAITAAWFLALGGLIVLLVGRGLRVRLIRAGSRNVAAALTTAALLVLVAVAPLLSRLARLRTTGDYVSPTFGWKSSPGGVDVATLLLNPFGLVLGTVHATFPSHINIIEGTCTIGVALLIILFCGWSFITTTRMWSDARAWRAVALGFGLWALGPYLLVAGHRTPLMLPALVFQHLPLLDNARMPGRAIVVVYLALSVLTAATLAAVAVTWTRRSVFVTLTVIAIAELLPLPVPAWTPDVPQPVVALSHAPRGAVLDLPLGLRDGFGEIGRLDPRGPWYQTIHGHPMGGGFVARLSPAIRRTYEMSPALSLMLKLSSVNAGGEVEVPDIPRAAFLSELGTQGFRYVLLHRDSAAPRLNAFILQLGLPLITADNTCALYELPSSADHR
jgi:hypothetical protein